MKKDSDQQLPTSAACQQSSAVSAELLKKVRDLLPDTSVGDANELPKEVADSVRDAVPGQEVFTPVRGKYLPEIYNAEVDIGVRRESQKNPKLKRLRPIHKKIIALHLACWPHIEIARYLGISQDGISRIILDPLTVDLLAKQDEILNQEFARLKMMANETIRVGMGSDKPDSVRLKAATLFDKREQNQKVDAGLTAEDVMAKILANIQSENVQINVIGQQVNGDIVSSDGE